MLIAPPVDVSWTTVDDIISTLRKRWSGGRYLRPYAAHEQWTPISIPVRGPRAAELLDCLDEAAAWLATFERNCRTRGGSERLRIEYRTIKSRRLGSNEVPGRVWLDTFEQLTALLGVTAEVRVLDSLLAETRQRLPELVSWIVTHPQEALTHKEVWANLLATVGWIVEHPPALLYLRHIDVMGVDTKFVETYRAILADLLEQLLPDDRVDHRYTRGDFAGRFRFRRKPEYTRFRLLSARSVLPVDLSEVTLRTEELARLDPPVSRVFVVENEISYLAFPDVPDSIVVFGSGFALDTLKALLWLESKEIIYWGDIDTYGFAILNRLRARFASVRSILMDHQTLLAHPNQRVVEPIQTAVALPHLTPAEAELYHDLVEDRFGHHVRLEQERVRFSLVSAAISKLGPT